MTSIQPINLPSAVPTPSSTKRFELPQKIANLAAALFATIREAYISAVNFILFKLRINIPNRNTLLKLIQKPDVSPKMIENLVKRHPAGASKEALFTAVLNDEGIYETPLSLLLTQEHLTSDLVKTLLMVCPETVKAEFYKYNTETAESTDVRSPLHLFFKECKKNSFKGGEVAEIIKAIALSRPNEKDSSGLFHPSALALLAGSPCLQSGAFKALVDVWPCKNQLAAPYKGECHIKRLAENSAPFDKNALAKELWNCFPRDNRAQLFELLNNDSQDPAFLQLAAICLELMRYDVNGTLKPPERNKIFNFSEDNESPFYSLFLGSKQGHLAQHGLADAIETVVNKCPADLKSNLFRPSALYFLLKSPYLQKGAIKMLLSSCPDDSKKNFLRAFSEQNPLLVLIQNPKAHEEGIDELFAELLDVQVWGSEIALFAPDLATEGNVLHTITRHSPGQITTQVISALHQNAETNKMLFKKNSKGETPYDYVRKSSKTPAESKALLCTLSK